MDEESSSKITEPVLSITWTKEDVLNIAKNEFGINLSFETASDILEEQSDLLESLIIDVGNTVLTYAIKKFLIEKSN